VSSFPSIVEVSRSLQEDTVVRLSGRRDPSGLRHEIAQRFRLRAGVAALDRVGSGAEAFAQGVCKSERVAGDSPA
jgi:hypothetical protein